MPASNVRAAAARKAVECGIALILAKGCSLDSEWRFPPAGLDPTGRWCNHADIGSIDGDVGGLHHRRPGVLALPDHPAHHLGRAAERLGLELPDALLHVGLAVARADRIGDLAGDFCRR